MTADEKIAFIAKVMGWELKWEEQPGEPAWWMPVYADPYQQKVARYMWVCYVKDFSPLEDYNAALAAAKRFCSDPDKTQTYLARLMDVTGAAEIPDADASYLMTFPTPEQICDAVIAAKGA